MDGIFEFPQDNLPDALEKYWKIASIYALHRFKLPTVSGLIVTKWDTNIHRTVLAYIKRMGWNDILIRSDTTAEKARLIPGGYLIKSNEIEEVVLKLLSIERVVLLSKPSNKYDNLYGINILVNIDELFVLLEIVGPGFDVTDINRGNINPHERIKYKIRDSMVTPIMSFHEIIDNREYLNTVQIRLNKIASEAIDLRRMGIDTKRNKNHERSTYNYLESNGSILLFTHSTEYTPFPTSFQRRLLQWIKDLPWQLPSLSTEKEYIVSCSVLNEPDLPRFIFWDIDLPSKKYDIRNL